jgi:hypothetical protein
LSGVGYRKSDARTPAPCSRTPLLVDNNVIRTVLESNNGRPTFFIYIVL